MPRHSHAARHRAAHQATSKPRLIAGLALPTAATLALMFGATGAAVATSPAARNITGSHGASSWKQATATQEAATPASNLKTLHDEMAAVRAAKVARGVARKNLAARVKEAKAVAAVKAAAQAKDAARAKQAELAHSWRLPIKHPVKTSGFGYRWGRLHAGEDFGVSVGTALASMSTGKVVFAGAQSGYGNIVQIRYWDGTISYFGHMSSISVKVGQAVAPGRIVGLSGNTGHSTGPHLHLEIHPSGGKAIDPLPWLSSHHIATS